jgi:hypothetical protein
MTYNTALYLPVYLRMYLTICELRLALCIKFKMWISIILN